MQVIVSNLLTDYTAMGSGSTILMLHGWGDSKETFKLLAKDLSGNHNVVTLDLPGFGKSQAPSTAWGLDQYANFVNQFIQKINIKPVIVIGHSVGGAITIRAAASNLIQPEKIVLLASAGIRNDSRNRKYLMKMLAKIAKIAVMPLPVTTRQKLKREVYQAVGSDLYVAEHMQETFKLVIQDDVTLDSKLIKQPALLIYGDKDRSTPVKYGALLAANIAKSKLNIIHAGHFLHHDQPDEISRLIRAFIES